MGRRTEAAGYYAPAGEVAQTVKSKNAVLKDYDHRGNPIVDNPKRMTKTMRKQFFGKGPSGTFGEGRARRRNQERIMRSAKYRAEQRKKAK
jgi:hypothetical protein